MAKKMNSVELFDDVMAKIENLIAVQAGCRTTSRRLPQQYEEMIGEPLPLCGMKNVVDLLRISPQTFDLQPLSDGRTYEISLVRLPHEQAVTTVRWNERSASVRHNKNNNYRNMPSTSSSASVLPLDTPQIQQLCLAVETLLEEANGRGEKYITIDNLIASKHPAITCVNPARYGTSGFFELLQMLSGSRFCMDVVDGLVVVLSGKK